MMPWPATPDKATLDTDSSALSSSRVNSSSREGANVTRLNQLAELEPSPASTYGETAIGESVPVTPDDLNDSSVIAQSFRGRQANSGQRDKFVGNAEDLKYVVHPCGLSSSPESHSKKVSAAVVSGSSPISGTSSQLRSTLTSPSVSRKSVLRDANWRKRVVSFAVPQGDNDPFLENRTDEMNNGKVGTSTNSSPSKTPTTPSGDTARGDLSSYRPREDREVIEISGDNAQALFPPNACVFVANLVSTLTDEQLEYSVTRAFEQFGRVYVKIKRDGRNMPYAFCQYENITDSERAIQHGRGTMIDGRQCRTERAKVNRSLYLSRTTGGAVSEAEARQILAGRGDLEKLWHSSQTDMEMFRLPKGIWVMFAFFQDCRDAQNLFKDNSDYRLEQPALPDEVRTRLGRTSISPMARASPARSFITQPSPLVRQTNERTSIFVGNLPTNISQSQLRALFVGFGHVRGVEIISRQSSHAVMNIFGYVEFNSEEEARKATDAECIIDGHRLRIELRDSSDHVGHRRLNVVSGGSPRPRQTGSSNMAGMLHRETAIQRAIAAGIHPATVHQIFGPQGLEHPEGVGVSVAPGVYAGVPYYAPYYQPQYAPYGNAAGGPESDQTGFPVYGPTSHLHHSMGHYSYPQTATGPYHPNYAAPSYAYASMAPDGNAAAGLGGTGENLQ